MYLSSWHHPLFQKRLTIPVWLFYQWYMIFTIKKWHPRRVPAIVRNQSGVSSVKMCCHYTTSCIFFFFHNWYTLPTIFFSVIVKLAYPFAETFSLWLYQWWVGRRGAFAAYPLQGMGRCFCLSFLLLFSDNCSVSNEDSPFDTLLTGC